MSLSHARLLATPWTAAYQAPPPMGFSRQEYWSGVPLPSPVDLPHPGTEHASHLLHWQADALLLRYLGNPKAFVYSASYNASASVLSPPTGQKNCKMASKRLTA